MRFRFYFWINVMDRKFITIFLGRQAFEADKSSKLKLIQTQSKLLLSLAGRLIAMHRQRHCWPSLVCSLNLNLAIWINTYLLRDIKSTSIWNTVFLLIVLNGLQAGETQDCDLHYVAGEPTVSESESPINSLDGLFEGEINHFKWFNLIWNKLYQHTRSWLHRYWWRMLETYRCCWQVCDFGDTDAG